jgi:hypothetical protein
MAKKMSKDEMIDELYKRAYKNAPHVLYGTGYYKISPKELKMDNGDVVQVEWVQPSAWTRDVLINYQTDSIKTTKLSEKELKQLMEII